MPAADRVARDHRDDRLGQPADLHVQVGDVEAPDRRALGDVAGVAADPLVAARAERERPLAGQHDHADRRVLAGALERVGDLHDRLRPERVADLGAVDGDLRDAVAGQLVADVRVVARRAPGDAHDMDTSLLPVPIDRGSSAPPPCGPRSSPWRRPISEVTYAELLERARAVAAGLAERGVRGGDRVAIALPAGPRVRRRAARLPAARRRGRADRRSARATGARAPARRRGDHDRRPARAGPARRDRRARRGRDRARRPHLAARPPRPRPVELSFGNVQANALGSAVALGLDRDERWLCPLPLSHVGGLMVLLRSAVYGTTALLARRERPRERHARLARADPARPPARRRRDARPAPAGGPARRRAARPRPARAGARRRLAGRADLRADPGVLAGHGRRAGRQRDLRPPAPRPARGDRAGRRDPRHRPDRRRRRHAAHRRPRPPRRPRRA